MSRVRVSCIINGPRNFFPLNSRPKFKQNKSAPTKWGTINTEET